MGARMSGLDGIEISDHPRREEIFTPEATAFVADLVRPFRDQIGRAHV